MLNPKRATPRDIVIIRKSQRQRILKVMFKRASLLKLSVGFKAKITQAKREWDVVFKILGRKKDCQPRLLCLAKLSFRNEIKSFPNKQKLNYTRSALQNLLKRVLQAKMKQC